MCQQGLRLKQHAAKPRVNGFINFEETQLCQAVATECLPRTCETMGPILYSAQTGPGAYIYNPSSQKVEVGRSKIQGHLWIHS